MAVAKISSGHTYGQPTDARVIGGSGIGDKYSMMYGISAEEAYTKLMDEARSNMTMSSNLGGQGGYNTEEIGQNLDAFNSFITGQNDAQKEVISGSDFFKNQMSIAERRGATERTPAMSALGGGTMGAPLSGKMSAIGSPTGVADAAKFKAKGGGK